MHLLLDDLPELFISVLELLVLLYHCAMDNVEMLIQNCNLWDVPSQTSTH
jgi:hypothetical protein